MSKDFDPINDPTSHLSRYLAFFQLPGINPDCVRQEVVAKFENPNLSLLEADTLLREETVGRVEQAVKGVGEKMARNGVSGAHSKYPESSLYGKSVPVVFGDFPTGMPNVNKAFGMMGGGFSPGDLRHMGIGPVGNEVVKTDFRSYMAQQIEERRSVKLTLSDKDMIDVRPHRVIGHDPGTGKFALMDVDETSVKLSDIIDRSGSYGKVGFTRGTGQSMDLGTALRQHEKLIEAQRIEEYTKDPFAACYSWGRRTGKTRLDMTVWKAIEEGCFFADTWIKPLYWAMFKQAPSIR